MRLSILFEDELELHDKDEWGNINELIRNAAKRGKRDSDLERFILDQHDSYHTYLYARDVIKGRWVEGEEAIKNEPIWVYYYARDVIEGRWIEGEEEIKKDLRYTYYYAKDIIKGRWLEGEEGIRKDSKWAYYYARYVLNLSNRDAREWSGYKT